MTVCVCGAYMCVHVYVCVCIYVCLCVYVYVCVYVCVCVYCPPFLVPTGSLIDPALRVVKL